MSKKVTSKLLKTLQPAMAFGGALLILTLVASTGFATNPSNSRQDQESSSRRESEAIKAVEKAGGRVYRISAADTTREVSFNLTSPPITDGQLKGINAIGEVIWVNLAGTGVTNDGLKHLAGLPLKKLHLERTKIGDDGLQHLKSFKDLEYLNVYDTKVTDAGLEHLKELKNLKKLYVWKSSVTEAGIKKLNESLPELEIVGELKLKPVVVEEPKKEPAKKQAAKKKPAKKGPAKKEPAKKEPAKKGPAKKEPAKKDQKKKEQPENSDQKADPKKEASKKGGEKAKAKDK